MEVSLLQTRKFWGWGYEGVSASPAQLETAKSGLSALLGGTLVRREPPSLDQIRLEPSSLASAPSQLEALIDRSPRERLGHAMGKSYRDLARAVRGDFSTAPDAVAFPESEQELADLLSFATEQRCSVIPYGGGTSVHGGVTPTRGEGPVLSLDLRRMSGVVEVDRESLLARVRAGTLGPELEAQLKPHGLSLRHFPQSFEHSTVGGWIATRAGGHFATGPTHIDDLVASLAVVTPSGSLETRRLPGSGAGPQAERMFIGSEGALGVITEAWLRVFPRPTRRCSATVRFSSMNDGLSALRSIVQAGIAPTNARLLDNLEALLSGAGAGDSCLLLLAFESAGVDFAPLLEAACEIARSHGGLIPAEQVRVQAGGRDDTADSYKSAFFRAPYLRDELALMDVFAETYETAVPWSKVEALDAAVRAALSTLKLGPHALARRITHVYRDGCAPYYTLICRNPADPDGFWLEVKHALTNAILREGGTATHHHAVGKELASAWAREVPTLFQQALRAAKSALDPNAIMNPGVLLPRG